MIAFLDAFAHKNSNSEDVESETNGDSKEFNNIIVLGQAEQAWHIHQEQQIDQNLDACKNQDEWSSNHTQESGWDYEGQGAQDAQNLISPSGNNKNDKYSDNTQIRGLRPGVLHTMC